MPDMTPEEIEEYMNEIHSLPHIEYHKTDPEIFIQKEETDEEPEGDSSGRPRADDA